MSLTSKTVCETTITSGAACLATTARFAGDVADEIERHEARHSRTSRTSFVAA